MFKVCPRYVQGMSKVCPRYVQGMFKVCSRYVQGMFKVCTELLHIAVAKKDYYRGVDITWNP